MAKISSDSELKTALDFLELKYKIFKVLACILAYVFVSIVMIGLYALISLFMCRKGLDFYEKWWYKFLKCFVFIDTSLTMLLILKFYRKKKSIFFMIIYIESSFGLCILLNGTISTELLLVIFLYPIPFVLIFAKFNVWILKICKCFDMVKYYSYENLILIKNAKKQEMQKAVMSI